MANTLHNPKCFHQHIGMWMAHPKWLTGAVNAVQDGTMPVRHTQETDVVDPSTSMRMDIDNIALINVSGAIMKGDSKFEGTVSSIRLRQEIRDAARDDSIKGILLNIDSPGGTFAGTDQLAKDIQTARNIKPVRAFIDDLGASAAYWIASQAEQVSATPTTEIGSIGTVVVVEDTSGAAEMQGVVVHVISTGPMKGAFAEGAPITEEMIDTLQKEVEQANEFFMEAVQSGRGMDMKAVRALATGDTFFAKEAKALGLIDKIETFDEAVESLIEQVSPRSRTRSQRVNTKLRNLRLGLS